MGSEAAKTKALWDEFEHGIVSGDGIDIGCGSDPITERVKRFDVEDGDANEITKYVDRQFDFVFSSHCLEHMHNPKAALDEWWQLVKAGGHLIVIVPDEDLYEQGYFPSLFNEDHKSTFTLSKERSWSPVSFNILELIKSLGDSQLVKAELQDKGYDRSLHNHSRYSQKAAFKLRRTVKRLSRITRLFGLTQLRLSKWLHLPIDQTSGEAVAQIQVIVRKIVCIDNNSPV